MAKGRGARGKYTPELVEEICSAIALEGTDEAGYKNRITPETFYVWLKEKPEFSESVIAARSEYRLNLPESDRRQARKAFVSYLYGNMEKIHYKSETGVVDGRPFEKETVTRIPVGTPRWAVERVLGKGQPSEIEALVTLVEAGWIPREVLNLAISELDRVKKTLRQVFEGILPSSGDAAIAGLSDETASAIRGRILGIEPKHDRIDVEASAVVEHSEA